MKDVGNNLIKIMKIYIISYFYYVEFGFRLE